MCMSINSNFTLQEGSPRLFLQIHLSFQKSLARKVSLSLPRQFNWRKQEQAHTPVTSIHILEYKFREKATDSRYSLIRNTFKNSKS